MTFDFLQVKDFAAAAMLSELASEIWHEHYDKLIGSEQVNYMIAKFQSPEAIINDIKEKNYEYFILSSDCDDKAGYYAVKPDLAEKSLFLSKIYLSEKFRGHGLSRKMIDHMKARHNPSYIWLTVNKGNSGSIKVYQHFGFEIISEQKSDIGSGYYMDDYVMKMQI